MSERMYDELADVWTLVSAVSEYVEEADLFKRVIFEHAPCARTLLELGCGGGNNAHHLKTYFEMTLVDRSEPMIRQSRKINPELRHEIGDMRDVRLGETFDAVFIHDAISYMTSRADLRRAIETACEHCRPGGLALFAPDHTAERFVSGASSCGGSDDGARGVRYLEWSWDPDPDDEVITTEYALLVRDEHGTVRVFHDRHLNGLFARRVWLDTMEAVGFDARVDIYGHSDLENGYELFVGVRR